MSENERRRLAPQEVEAIEWLLDLFLPCGPVGKGGRLDPANADQVAEVRGRLGILRDLKQALRDYVAGAYFDDDPEQRLRTKGAQLTLNSVLTLVALGSGDDEGAVRTAQREDAACLERLDGKYAVTGPPVYESDDERVEAVVQTVQAAAAYRAYVMELSGIDQEKPFADLCQAVAAKLSQIPVGDSPDGPMAMMAMPPTDPFVIKYCAVALVGLTKKELANAGRIEVDIPLDAPIDEEGPTGPLSIQRQVRELVLSFREVRARAREQAKAEGCPLTPISRLGARAMDAMKRVHELPDLVHVYLREAAPVNECGLTPGQSIIEHAPAPFHPGDTPVSVDDVVAMMKDVANRLIQNGVSEDIVASAIHGVMEENGVPFRL